MNRYLILLFTGLFLSINHLYAWNDPTKSGKSKKDKNSNNSFVLKAANCTPATGRKFLEYNNRALDLAEKRSALISLKSQLSKGY